MSAPSIRVFAPTPLHSGAKFALPEPQSHYLLNVMRLRVGARLLVFDGMSGEYEAEINAATRKAASLTVLHQTRPLEPPGPDIFLCFALLKRQKTDLVVEKATELGATHIQPVITARTQADHVNLERLRAITIEAAEQCESLSLPAIFAPVPLAKLVSTLPEETKIFIADERRTAPPLRRPPGEAPLALIIGPEGGFTEAELAAIGGQQSVNRVSLGARILRAETAAIAGLALLLAAGRPEES